MRLQLVHTIGVAAIASLAAWVGLNMLLPGAEQWMLCWTIAASVFIWIAFGNLYLHAESGMGSAIYLGLLSPVVGCILVFPPFSLFVVFSSPVKSVSLGIITSVVVWAFSRRLAAG